MSSQRIHPASSFLVPWPPQPMILSIIHSKVTLCCDCILNIVIADTEHEPKFQVDNYYRNSWGRRELDTTEPLNWTELNWSHLYNSLLLICPFWTFSELTVASDIIIISFLIHAFTFLHHLYSVIIIITPLHLLPNTQHLCPPSYLPSKPPIFLKSSSLLCPSAELGGWRKAYSGAVWCHLNLWLWLTREFLVLLAVLLCFPSWSTLHSFILLANLQGPTPSFLVFIR